MLVPRHYLRVCVYLWGYLQLMYCGPGAPASVLPLAPSSTSTTDREWFSFPSCHPPWGLLLAAAGLGPGGEVTG